MDFDWDKFPTVDKFWSSEFEENSADGWGALHLGAFLQVVMNAHGSVASDYREAPRLLYLPSDCNASFHGIFWKMNTNGTTFVALRHQSAKYLAPLIGLNEYSNPTLITLKAD